LVYEGHQSYNSCSFDASGQVSLLFCSQTGNPAGQNFTAFCDVFFEQIDIFVVYRISWFDWRNAPAKVCHGLLFFYCCLLTVDCEFLVISRELLAVSKAFVSYLLFAGQSILDFRF